MSERFDTGISEITEDLSQEQFLKLLNQEKGLIIDLFRYDLEFEHLQQDLDEVPLSSLDDSTRDKIEEERQEWNQIVNLYRDGNGWDTAQIFSDIYHDDLYIGNTQLESHIENINEIHGEVRSELSAGTGGEGVNIDYNRIVEEVTNELEQVLEGAGADIDEDELYGKLGVIRRSIEDLPTESDIKKIVRQEVDIDQVDPDEFASHLVDQYNIVTVDDLPDDYARRSDIPDDYVTEDDIKRIIDEEIDSGDDPITRLLKYIGIGGGETDPEDREKLYKIGGVALVAAGLTADYQNWNEDDLACGEGFRFFKQPSGDFDFFGYGADQEACAQPNDPDETRDMDPGNVTDTPVTGQPSGQEWIERELNETEFENAYDDLSNVEQRQLEGFYQDAEDYLDEGDGGRELVSAKVSYNPGGDPTNSKIRYTIELEDGGTTTTKWFTIDDEIAEEFVEGGSR